MSHGPTKIPSFGRCIYCGSDKEPLTDEHIVPLSLGGQHVLEAGSCPKCAQITSAFELDVCRGLWGDARISYDAPSRRKKKRKTHITLPPAQGEATPITIPYSEYPGAFTFYTMRPAGYLQGLPKDVDISREWQFSVIVDESRKEDFLRKYPNRLTMQFKHVPESFGRLLAKIAYGNTLCSLHPDDFHPLCLPYILGAERNISYIVGSDFSTAAPTPGIGYELNTGIQGSADKITIVSEIRLLANNQTPKYHVIVGEVYGRENVKNILSKLGP